MSRVFHNGANPHYQNTLFHLLWLPNVRCPNTFSRIPPQPSDIPSQPAPICHYPSLSLFHYPSWPISILSFLLTQCATSSLTSPLLCRLLTLQFMILPLQIPSFTPHIWQCWNTAHAAIRLLTVRRPQQGSPSCVRFFAVMIAFTGPCNRQFHFIRQWRTTRKVARFKEQKRQNFWNEMCCVRIMKFTKTKWYVKLQPSRQMIIEYGSGSLYCTCYGERMGHN